MGRAIKQVLPGPQARRVVRSARSDVLHLIEMALEQNFLEVFLVSLLVVIRALLHIPLSLPTEVCSNPNWATLYHIFDL